MEENMCVTIEPGCYFIDHLIDEALNNSDLSEYLVEERLEKFRRFGGIRLEGKTLEITESPSFFSAASNISTFTCSIPSSCSSRCSAGN